MARNSKARRERKASDRPEGWQERSVKAEVDAYIASLQDFGLPCPVCDTGMHQVGDYGDCLIYFCDQCKEEYEVSLKKVEKDEVDSEEILP